MSSSANPAPAPEPSFAGVAPATAAALLTMAGDVVLVVDEVGVIRDVAVGDGDTPFAAARQWVGRPWVETVHTDSRGKAEALLREALLGGVTKRRQLNHLRDDGADVPVAYTALRLERGTVVAVGRDMRHVSALQQRLVEAQQAMERDYWRLRHVETRYRLLFQLASDGILVLDATSLQVLDANAAAGALFGESPDRLIGRPFPLGVHSGAVDALEGLCKTARSSGRAGDVTVELASGVSASVSASCFRQESSTLLLVRFAAADGGPGGAGAAGNGRERALALLERLPDGFVITDLDGRIVLANRAFLDIAELVSEDQVRGTQLSNVIGRPGADFPVFLEMLRKHGTLRLVATAARGVHGHQTEVEVSAVWLPDGDAPSIGFTIRDIGRRLAAGPQGARDLSRAVEELTSLVGRVSLRDLVRDTVDLVERHFIEAALELTNDNRTSASEVLGVSRQSLYVKMRRHKLADAAPDRDDGGAEG
jgi:transcriptional regulator PpsR